MKMLPSRNQPQAIVPMKRPRQDPVSCQFCRSKKLKCNREQPCSNCASRGLSCTTTSASVGATNGTLPDFHDSSIIARLKRLEDIVLGSSQQSSPRGAGLVPNSTQSKPTTPLAGLSPTSEYEEALHHLEDTGTRDHSLLWPHSTDLDLRISSAQQISLDYGIAQQMPNTPSDYLPSSKTISLPPRREAFILLDNYFKFIDALQHVIYVPHVWKVWECVYSNLEQGLPVIHGQVALLLSICANACALHAHQKGEANLPFSPTDAGRTSLVWINATLEVLGFSRRAATARLEDVQATIILGFLLYHTEGFSTRTRSVFANAIAVSRDIELHKIDAPTPTSQRPNVRSPTDHIEQEIKRRVWWHVVATDWSMSLTGGPQEGTYLIQPKHMQVKKPRNVNDEDLLDENSTLDLPTSEPTTMSYYVQRIKLAEICRNIVDAMPLNRLDLSSLNYEDVIALDGQFESFFRELPPFLRLDEDEPHDWSDLFKQYPQIQTQRHALIMIANCRRCKLHQPFLIRGASDGHYAFSREVALKSARWALRSNRLAEKERSTALSTNIKHTGVIFHIFMATVVLVMDLCFNKAEGDDIARKQEVLDAFRILEDAKCQSRMANKFLTSLMDVLAKYKVYLHLPSNAASGDAFASENGLPTPLTSVKDDATRAQPQHDMESWPEPEVSKEAFSDFDIWKDFVEFGPTMDQPEWDLLYSEIDSKF